MEPVDLDPDDTEDLAPPLHNPAQPTNDVDMAPAAEATTCPTVEVDMKPAAGNAACPAATGAEKTPPVTQPLVRRPLALRSNT